MREFTKNFKENLRKIDRGTFTLTDRAIDKKRGTMNDREQER